MGALQQYRKFTPIGPPPAIGYKANVLLLSPISCESKSQPRQLTAASVGPRVRCDYYVFMTAVVDIRLVTTKCRSFTNLQT